MTLLSIVIGVLALYFIVSFLIVARKTDQLNVDPLQDALADAIEQLNREGHTPDARRRFSDVAAGLFHKYRMEHLEVPLLRYRLVHSLSLLRHRLPKIQFKQTEHYLTRWQMPPTIGNGSFGVARAENLSSQPVQIFLSYAREDQSLARIIAAQLEASGCSVWWDDGLEAGDRWDTAIQRQLEAATAVVVLWSPFASVSEWVRKEAQFASDCGKLIPVFIGQCRLPSGFSRIHAVDLIDWKGDVTAENWLKVISSIHNDGASLQNQKRR